jgi:CO/xanthine dehydrogenase Mo-binding subunit
MKNPSRRAFLQRSGALVVAFSSSALVERLALAQGPFGTRMSHVDPRQLDSWISVNADGTVTGRTGKCELGQGIYTAQLQLIAEELSVPLERVKLLECDTDGTPDQGTTSGSQSTPTNFNDRNLAQAAATARETLLRLASERLGLPVTELAIADGVVSARADATRRITYSELVAGRRFSVPLSSTVKRKVPGDWKVLGQPVPRVDLAELVTGRFEFVHNVRRPGMLHGRVVRPPEPGATVAAVDEASVHGLPGVVKVVVQRSFVGVVAEKPWQAVRAAGQLRVTWTTGVGLPIQRDYYGHLRKQPARDAFLVDSRDVDDTLARAADVVKATYLHPYQMHGSVGTSCAVADVSGGRATVWSATQSAYPTRSGVAQLLGMPVDNVRVIFVRGSGCYGINGADTVSYDAALLSKAVGRPVRVQLTRQDEMAWENYGSAYVIDQRVGLDATGQITAWDYESWSPSRGGRPGYDRPGNVVTGWTAGYEPLTVTPGRAAEPARSFNNGSNAAPSYVTGCTGAGCGGAGTVKSERILTHAVTSPFFTGPLRSPSRLQNTFAHECLMDEVAARVKADPIAYRLRHLTDQRLIDVLRAAEKAAGWRTRPSPGPESRRQDGVVGGRGCACVIYEGDNGHVAMVAEVDVDLANGRIAVKRLIVAQDCGPISNPDGMRQQIEGGALQGLSRAMGEELTWDDRRVTSVDWQTYRSLSLGFDSPAIESVLIDRPGVAAAGAGETAITVVAAAVGNAVFDATGARIRQVPFTPERVKAALGTRA